MKSATLIQQNANIDFHKRNETLWESVEHETELQGSSKAPRELKR